MELERMTTTIIGTVDNAQVGKNLMAELIKSGLDEQGVEVLQGADDAIMSDIVGRGFDEDSARGFLASLDGDKILVAARVTDDQVKSTLAIIERFEVSDKAATVAGTNDETLLEIDEELAVTKSEVAQGGVRVSRSVTEQPVEETVTLRTETVDVDHKPVSRTLSAEEAKAAFQDKTLEMIGTTEEVEVTKEARVVGEVSLSKQSSEHEQKVQDTVRRTQVEVEQVGTKTPKRK
jgi:uncharacterized protein (TIGR02271 family)